MKYGKARELVESALEQLDEVTRKQKAAHNAKFAKIRAKNKANNAKQKAYLKKHPLESPAYTTGRSVAGEPPLEEAIELSELSDRKLRGYVLKSALNAAVDAPTSKVSKRLKGIGKALKKLSESSKTAKGRYRKGIANAMNKIGSIKKPEPFKPIDNPFTKPFKGKKVNEAARRSNRSVSSRAKAIMDKWHEDLMSGKATEDMLNQIANHHADAVKKYNVERANAKTHVENKIRHAHHKMRAEHYKTHIGNYEKHYANAKAAHDAGDYRRASAEGSHAATGPHLRDVPHHVDYHVASYYDK